MQKWYLRFGMNLFMFTIGLIINVHYWQTEQFSDIKQVSITMMTLVIVYIAFHFFKRVIFVKIHWWDWLYYIALLSIVLPVFLADSLTENFYHWIIDLGTTFFIIPIVMDTFKLFNIRIKTEE